MSTKTTYIINPDLFSGSADLFRTSFGGFFITEDEQASFINTTLEIPAEDVFDAVYYEQQQTVADYSNIIPNYTVPVRVASNGENIVSDQDWRAYILGGVFGDKEYNTKISNTQHEYINISYDLPYSMLEINSQNMNSATDIVEIGYDYRQHLQQYQDTISSFETEMYIPNYYILSDLYLRVADKEEDIEKIYSTDLLNLVSLEGNFERPQTLFDFNMSEIPYSVPSFIKDNFTDIRKNNTDLTKAYLNSSQFSSPSDSKTIEWATTKQKGILLDNKAVDNTIQQDPLYECLPYNVKINLTTKKSGEFVESYIETGFDSKLLSSLNDTFTSEVGIIPEEKNYNRSTTYNTVEDGLDIENYEVVSETYREINYLDFLTYCRDQYKNQNPQFMFVGEKNINRVSAENKVGTYRHVGTSAAVRSILHAVDFLNDSTKTNITNWDSFFGDSLGYNETIAYRIEKIGGSPSGDGRTQNALQNYWFINTPNQEVFEFFDNQIINNKDYTYNIYAYVLGSGIKYEYADLLLTRNLGCEDQNKEGLEFYDPTQEDYNNQPRLFSGSVDTNGFDDTAGGTYGTEAQIYTSYKYLADFNIKYEPELKIMEIPIYSKTLRVLDNPPNKINVKPYQVLDDSQTICFDLYNGTFSNLIFPSPITESDQEYKDNYLNANDITDEQKINKSTVSELESIEVYRISEKPTSMRDFENNLYRTLNLTIENQRNYTRQYIKFSDQISTNTKYYYVFRSVNKNGTPGQATEIYETELINDGGYKFALFDTLTESELQEENTINPSIAMKKLFQLRPNLNHLILDTSNADFTQTAESQIGNVKVGSAEDLVWDKTFKTRLTSRKTGKKIDLNITYKIGSE